MTLRLPVILSVCALVLSGCSAVQRVNPFNTWQPDAPLPYRAKLSAARRDPAFSVRVDTGGAPITAWRESARFPATRHCLRRFGSSEIDWRSSGGPEDWIVARDADGGVVVSGRCIAR